LKNNPSLVWLVLLITAITVLALGGLAWLMSIGPALAPDQQEMETAIASVSTPKISRSQISEHDRNPALVDSATATPFQTIRTIQQTLTPGASIKRIFGDPVVILGPSTWLDSFDSDGILAPGENLCARVEINDGILSMSARGDSPEYCLEIARLVNQDFYLEVVVEANAPCSDGLYGLQFRATEEGKGFLYGINCNGQYELTYRTPDLGSTLIPQTISNAIDSGPAHLNRIGVLAQGDRIDLYANGVFLAEVTVASRLSGNQLALFIKPTQGDPLAVNFDNLQYWDLSK
jgi:hypothetical protein